jgi:uncharacterized protein YwqG
MPHENLTTRIAAHRRTAYIPTVENGDGSAGGSKFSGVPCLAAGEPWPACGNCGRPLQLFVQLAADELPAEARERIGAGKLLQFFYCTSTDPDCESDAEAFLPHARSTLVRIVSGAPAAGEPRALPAGMFPPRRITGWTETDDYPSDEELDGLAGAALDEDDLDALAEEFPRLGEKLLGWPHWVQGMEYPACRVCGTEMRMLFQMDSNGALPYMFGDVGVGHVTQCPIHPDELAFGWACY